MKIFTVGSKFLLLPSSLRNELHGMISITLFEGNNCLTGRSIHDQRKNWDAPSRRPRDEKTKVLSFRARRLPRMKLAEMSASGVGRWSIRKGPTLQNRRPGFAFQLFRDHAECDAVPQIRFFEKSEDYSRKRRTGHGCADEALERRKKSLGTCASIANHWFGSVPVIRWCRGGALEHQSGPNPSTPCGLERVPCWREQTMSNTFHATSG